MPITWGTNTTNVVENGWLHNSKVKHSSSKIVRSRSLSRTHSPKRLRLTPKKLEQKLQHMEELNKNYLAEMKKRAKKQKAEKSGVLPSRIVRSAIGILVGLQELAGLPIPLGGSAWKGSPTYPYQGDCFKAGSEDFAEVAALLQMAVPHSWHGEAADAYTAANSTLMTQAQTMAILDREMENLVKNHAECVSQTQLGIGVEQDVLIVAYPIVLYLESNWQTFEVAMNSAIALAAAALLAALGLLGICLDTSIQTEQAVDRLAYGDVIAAAQAVIDAYSPASVPQSGGSAASDRAHVSGSVSVSSGISGTPTVASSPGAASGSGPQRTALDASTGAGQRFGVDSAQVAATADEVAPITPASPMASVAHVMQPSGQAANRAGSFASPSDRINPQGQQAGPEQAVLAADSEDTGAGSGTQGARRAPIGVAAVTTAVGHQRSASTSNR